MNKMTQDEIAEALQTLEGWSAVEGRDAITRKFEFQNFRAAWTFMEDVAVEADEMSHHPEWTNIYSKVDVTLTTHDVGGVSEADIELAEFMNAVAETVSRENFDQ